MKFAFGIAMAVLLGFASVSVIVKQSTPAPQQTAAPVASSPAEGSISVDKRFSPAAQKILNGLPPAAQKFMSQCMEDRDRRTVTIAEMETRCVAILRDMVGAEIRRRELQRDNAR